jgi:hypothetical protein
MASKFNNKELIQQLRGTLGTKPPVSNYLLYPTIDSLVRLRMITLWNRWVESGEMRWKNAWDMLWQYRWINSDHEGFI